jgi:hypothetical protein
VIFYKSKIILLRTVYAGLGAAWIFIPLLPFEDQINDHDQANDHHGIFSQISLRIK